ncbi:Mandelate racemase/muconate lactonizing protein [Croceitalea dokdonensis DOKDO 023]|uniref:Dipeptide epimerase n=1 Tax=Croceitalea dokdonensis DOKDO 023 TaxID=1300341 RepID=A0A0P7AY99_9FLAO|nr:dipeptide epimerase [Croceitalea dokdonensis]KPM33077.1 Mandelate racemase/muconate lactonizing protein [Croceitalea dokdonensis DOKDO 023]
MKITHVSYERLDLKLTEPYTIAYETVDRAVNFILKIETDTNIVGYGCAAPDQEVTQESFAEVENNIKGIIIPFLRDKNPLDTSRLLQELAVLFNKKSSALAMVDMALLDIAAKKMGVPLYQFLGGYRTFIPTSITIGILPLEDTLKKASDFVGQGFTVLKLKGGLSVDEDIEKVNKIFEVHPNIKLRFDANQGYDLERAIKFFKETKNANIEIFEQPSAVDKAKLLGAISKAVALPVMADESIKTLDDVYELARKEQINMVNIKLMKVGGIREGMHINSVAKAAGLQVMVGCLDECGLGISAGLHFALSRPNIGYADLDGHLDFIQDPFAGMVVIRNGTMYPNLKNGLGV